MELHSLRPVARLGFAVIVLFCVPALKEAAMPDPARRGSLWRCRVFRWHDFVVRSTSDGGRFQQCARCGVDRGPVSHHPMTTPPYPVGSA